MNTTKLTKYAIILGKRGGRRTKNSSILMPPSNEVISAARALGEIGGILGGRARADVLKPAKRKEIAQWASLVAKLKRDPSSLTLDQEKEFNRLKELGYKLKEERI